jgi:hypothetical protein
MKIQNKDYLGLRFLKDSGSELGAKARERVVDMTFEQEKELGWNILETARRHYVVEELLDDKKFKTYLIAETAQKMAERLKIDTDEDLSILEKLDAEFYTYLLNKNEFIRFFRKGVNLYVYHFHCEAREIEHLGRMVPAEWVQVEYFSIFIPYGTATLEKERHKELAKRLIRLICFIRFSDVEVLLLPPGKKVGGSRSSGNAVFNETKYPITRVDSNWNKFTLRTDTIGVMDYFRFQRIGPGLVDRKLILIKAHERKGHVRVGGGAKGKTMPAPEN